MTRASLPFLLICLCAAAEPAVPLPATKPLTDDGDLSQKMLDGLHRFAERKLHDSLKSRASLWKRDTSSRPAYDRSVAPNRESFRRIIGATDPRLPPAMER